MPIWTPYSSPLIAPYVELTDWIIPAWKVHRGPGRPPQVTDAELVCLAVAQVLVRHDDERHWLRAAASRVGHLFARLREQAKYDARLKAAALMEAALQWLLVGALTGQTLVGDHDGVVGHLPMPAAVGGMVAVPGIPEQVRPLGGDDRMGWTGLCRLVYFLDVAVKGDGTRARMIEAARGLVEAKGYHGTGLNEVLAVAGAPRGSLYHHFPGGKDQLVAAALTAAGREVDGMVGELAATAPTARDLVLALLEGLADRMVVAGYAKGCPVATVALEVSATNDDLQSVCGGIYTGWQRALADSLRAEGHDAAEADELATTLLALIEGALLLARATRSRTPIEQTARRITKLLATG